MANTAWEGAFKPTGYTLNWKVLWALPVGVVSGPGEVSRSTVGAVIEELLPERLTNPDAAKRIQIASAKTGFPPGRVFITPEKTIQLESYMAGTGFAVQVLNAVVDLSREGIQDPLFFFYDQDHVTDDPHFTSYRFFVVGDNRIVSERHSFSRTSDNGFNVEVFKDAFVDEAGIWAAQSSILEAQVRWWYRRFYEETEAGRLTILRDDVPLYHFVPSWKIEAELALQVSCLAIELKTELKTIRLFVAGCLFALVLSLFHLF
jgi:hypothetical protein